MPLHADSTSPRRTVDNHHFDDCRKYPQIRTAVTLINNKIVIRKGRIWFGHMECKDDADWVKHCITTKIDGIGLGKSKEITVSRTTLQEDA